MRNRLVYTCLILFTCAVGFNACNEQEVNYQRYFVNGKQLYEQNCQNCHGSNGEGLGRLYPPLNDTTYLAENRSKLACIIKNGLSGKIAVNKESYEAVMPGNAALADIDVAQIIVYITNSFGNKQGFYDQLQVKTDLKDCK